jgi:hypothetical protein
MYIDPLVLDNKAMERDPFVHDLPITVHMANFYGHVRLLAGMSCVDGMGKPVDRTKVLWLLFVVLWCQRVPQGSPKIIKGRQCDDPLEYPFVLNRLLHISKMDNYSTRTHTYIYTYIHIHTHIYIYAYTIMCIYNIYMYKSLPRYVMDQRPFQRPPSWRSAATSSERAWKDRTTTAR